MLFRSPFRVGAVELQGVLSPLAAAWVVAIEKPAAGVHRQLLLGHPLGHVDAVGDAVAVGQDQRRPRIVLSLQEGPDRVLIAGAHRHRRDIDMAVGHRHQTEILLGGLLAAAGELGDGRQGCGFGALAAGVRVHLGVEHQNVHIAPRRQNVIEAAETVGQFIAGRKREELEQDRLLLFAVIRAIELIGEAASKVSEETRINVTTVPGGAIIGMRNRLVHGYFDIDPEIVWETACHEVPLLLPPLRDSIDKAFDSAE